MKSKNKKIESKLSVTNFIMLTVAGIINASGVKYFLNPVHLYDSGISGTSMLLDQITSASLSLSFFLLVLNIPLFLFGLKKQGKVFTIYAVYTVFIYSVAAWVITYIIPGYKNDESIIAGTDLLLCALFGGVLSGIGSGMAMRFGGAMDGIEVLSVIFAKRLGLTVGTFVMIYNAVLYIICGFMLHSWILPLYSIVTYFAGLKTIDFIVEGIDRSKSAMIITTFPDEVCEHLSKAFETGATIIDARGSYSKQSKTVIYFVINRFQVSRMKEIVHQIDAKAYITISDIADIYKANNSSK